MPRNRCVKHPGRENPFELAISKLLVEFRDLCDSHVSKFPDVHAVAPGDTLKEEVVGLTFSGDTSDPFPNDGQIIALVSLRVCAQQFHVDPECSVEYDPQLSGQFGSLTLGQIRGQITKVQIFGGLNIVAILGRRKEPTHAASRCATTKGIIRNPHSRPFRFAQTFGPLLDDFFEAGLPGIRFCTDRSQPDHPKCKSSEGSDIQSSTQVSHILFLLH